MEKMKNAYPLTLKFRLIALAPRVSVVDAKGQEIFYIEQKVFALKEAVNVFNNAKEKKLLYTLKADSIIDFGARYRFHNAHKKLLGSVQQEGMRSLFRGSYIVFDENDQEVFKVTQSNPWISVLDSVLNIIPFAEFVTGFILNPAYEITTNQKETVLRMKKKPSFFEAQFAIDSPSGSLTDEKELLVLLSLLMIVQLERSRG